MLNEATAANLARRAEFVDNVQLYHDKPLPSWIDLNLTELCNRSAGSPKACTFCPRIDAQQYPNQALHMPISLAEKIGDELRSYNFAGAVALCGFGEPMLHPYLENVVIYLSGLRVELITNGDYLSSDRIARLSSVGVTKFVVSMYDGKYQNDKFVKMFAEANCVDYVLRDRWHSEDLDFGLKLTNRSGTVTVGNQPPAELTKPCHYLAYQLTIDWQGDVLLCPQDWHKRVRYGNLQAQSLFEVWTSRAMHKKRMQLLAGKRSDGPCLACNADGTLLGKNHVREWVVNGALR